MGSCDLDTLSSACRAVLLNPTEEGAMQFWDWALLGPPAPGAALAGVHRARLIWPESTEAMRQESLKWLADHGFEPRPPIAWLRRPS